MIFVGATLVALSGLSGCTQGCTRMVDLPAQKAAAEYLTKATAADPDKRKHEEVYGASLHRLRAARGKDVVVAWSMLSKEDLSLAVSGLVGHDRDDEEDKLLHLLAEHGVDPFVADRFGRVPFAVAASADALAMVEFVKFINTSRARPRDQVMCGLHHWVNGSAAAKLRAFCQCK